MRDPVHGFIQRDSLEKSIIDTRIFQRLRRLRQLAMANLVYPGAVHSRFEHSIGALHIARELTEKLVKNESDRPIIRLAALLHDIGHGPFSHVSEPILQRFSDPSKVKIKNQDEIHEQISWSIILTDPELGRFVSEVDREKIVGVLSGTYGFSLYKDLVSGPIDVDKQDYLLRDSYFCGVKYGLYDRGRLADTLTVHSDVDDQILALTEDGKHALEQFVLAKYYMHTQVYRHKIRLITDQMISRGILLGIEFDGLEWLKSLYSYDGSDEFIKNYLEWHDDKLVLEMLRPETPDGKAKDMFRRVVDRKLLKRIYRATEKTFGDPAIRFRVFGDSSDYFKSLEKKIADAYKLDEDFVIVNKVAFKSATKTESDVVVSGPSGRNLFRDISVLFSSVNQSIQEQYLDVYAPVEYRDEREKHRREHEFYEEISGMISEILNPQQPLTGLKEVAK
ncbi:MAG: HD domain-containing protein [Candidatus Korobacteraceae bacterium]